MDPKASGRAIEILLVEDNPGDVRLITKVLKTSTVPNTVRVVRDGIEAMAFLYRQGKYAAAARPDLILLDLNLPRKNGHEVLDDIKQDPDLKRIPIVVLTSSAADQDILGAYDRHANCYVTKPLDLSQWFRVVKIIEEFWLSTVKLPVP